MGYVLIGAVYAVGAVVSWVCMVGWGYAYFQRAFPLIAKLKEQTDWRDACKFASVVCVFWPVMLPLAYFGWVERARYGWLWRVKEKS